jgi:outer membrane receptor protein involved in Fe transport
MFTLRQGLLGGSATAVLALLSLNAALAQDNSALEIETISSSASRIDLKGFEAPTPVTVVGIDQINRDAKINIGDQIRDLPQIRGGQGINSGSNSRNVAQANAGIDTISIRNLGTFRNLVLIDRQRVVGSSVQSNEVDPAMIPSSVIQRVDVVTGGASAAWGSDAVTGVVNLVINKTFEGIKGSFSYADKTEVDHAQYRGEAAWGTSFLAGKGHIMLAANWTISNNTVFRGQLYNDGRAFVYNPAYCNTVAYAGTATTGGTCASPSGPPLLIYAYNTGSATSTSGGLINSNTAGVAGAPLSSGSGTNSLKGLQFVGPEKSVVPFNYGTVHNNSICYNGCTNNVFTGLTPWDPIPAAPYHSANYFNYTSYQVLPDVKASIQLNYSRLSTRTFGGERLASNVTIYADNPFLPDSIARRFVCQGGAVFGTAGATCVGTLSNGYNPYTRQNDVGGLTLAQRQARPAQSMTMGLDYLNNLQGNGAGSTQLANLWTLDNLCEAIGVPCSYASKALMRGVFSLDGTIGDSWTWNSYLQWGATRIHQYSPSNAINARFNNAQDAVRITSGNVGTSGLPIGSIQCRGLLNPALAQKTANLPAGDDDISGCAPLDPFGYRNVSNAARLFIEPGLNPAKTGILNSTLTQLTQTAGALSLTGVLPWQVPAGEIGIAFGGEWRLESAFQITPDIRAQNTGWGVGNVNNFRAHYHVEEGFLEADIPLLKDNVVQSLALNLGGRLTSYSTSGLVETWKVGLTSQITDEFRFRGTLSYDIRAPNLWDLYTPGGPAGITCQPFVPGNGGNYPCFNVNGGNPNLQPERANTASAGLVFTPDWIPGLTTSFDWYQIHLHGGIITTNQNTILTQCRAGNQVFCNQIQFATPGDTLSQIAFIFATRVNAAIISTAGFDFAAAYGFDLFTGQMEVSFNGNYVYDFSQDQNGIYFQGAGSTNSFYSGGAKFQGTLGLNYREGSWTFGGQVRITGDSIIDAGTQGRTGLSYVTPTYAVVNGANVATVSAGQRGEGILETNYNAIEAPIDLRVQYRWSNNITLFGAIDNVQNLPTDTTLRRAYRFGVRFSY